MTASLLGALLHRGDAVMISGEPMPMLVEVAYAIGAALVALAAGQTFLFSTPPQGAKVLLIDGEPRPAVRISNHQAALRRVWPAARRAKAQQNLTAVASEQSVVLNRLSPGTTGIYPLTSGKMRANAARLVRSVNPALVIFSSIASLISVDDIRADSVARISPLANQIALEGIAQIWINGGAQRVDVLDRDAKTLGATVRIHLIEGFGGAAIVRPMYLGTDRERARSAELLPMLARPTASRWRLAPIAAEEPAYAP